MSSDIEADFAEELRAAAELAVQPAPASRYAGAVERGRRIRRTAIIKRTLVGVATLGVVVAVGVPLLGGSSRGGAATPLLGAAAPATAQASAKPAVEPTAGSSAKATPSASTGTSGGGASGAASGSMAGSGTGWMQAYVTQTVKSLFPAGYSTGRQSSLGVPFSVFAPRVEGLDGEWAAQVETDLATPNGRSTISVEVERTPSTQHCSGSAGAYDVCAATPLDGGTVTVDKTFKDPLNGTGNALWTLTWNGPDGQSVTVGEASGAAQALTVQQAEAILTAPAWDRVWQALPATCPYGAMADPRASQVDQAEGQALTCATSPAVALHLPGTPTPGRG